MLRQASHQLPAWIINQDVGYYTYIHTVYGQWNEGQNLPFGCWLGKRSHHAGPDLDLDAQLPDSH